MFCRKLIGGRDQGDDLYQDALVIACTKLGDLRDHAAFRPWLYRIIITTFKSTLRRPWWKRRAPMTSEIENSLASHDPVDAHTARRHLNYAFRSISVDDQALVVLHELDGWPIGDLACLLGKSEGSVKARLFRARRNMKETLQKVAKYARPKAAANSASNRREQCVATKPGLE